MTLEQAKVNYAAIGQTFKSNIGIYANLENAQGAQAKCRKPHSIILGDSGHYVLVTRAVGERLVNAGYQYA